MMKGLALFALLVAAMVFFSGCTDKVQAGNPSITGEPFRGGENAKVLLVVFSDFQCPVCGRAYLVEKEIEAAYGDQIKLVYKQFPLREIHPQAQKAAEASECAAAQNKFWEYHDVLFQNQNALDIASLKQYAKNLGLVTTQFDVCLDKNEAVPSVAKDYQEGTNLGVQGTPTYFINGKMYVGYLSNERFKQIIDGELAAPSK